MQLFNTGAGNFLNFSLNWFIILGRMGKIIRIFLAIGVVIIVNAYLVRQVSRSYHVFRNKTAPLFLERLLDIPDMRTPPTVTPVDSDGDGNDELYLIEVSDYPREKKIYSVPVKPVVNSRPISSMVTVAKDENFFFDAYVPRNGVEPVYRFLYLSEGDMAIRHISKSGMEKKGIPLGEIKHKLTGVSDSAMLHEIIDLDGDGRREMLMKLSSFYKHTPRGIVCFDLQSGELLWEYYGGTLIAEVLYRDLDGDGKHEVICSSNGISNGASMGGTSDAYSYVMVLDHKGNLIWIKKTGEWYTVSFIFVADLDKDGKLEIVTSTECHRPQATFNGKISVLDGRDGTELYSHLNTGASFSKPVVFDSGDNEARICVGDSSGVISLFDRELNSLGTYDAGQRVKVIAPAIEPGGWPYIMANTEEELMVFDRNLKTKVFSHRFEKVYSTHMSLTQSFFKPIRQTGKFPKKAVIQSDPVYLISQRRVTIWLMFIHAFGTGLLISILLSAAFNVFVIAAVLSLVYPGIKDIKSGKAGSTSHDGANGFIDTMRGIIHQVKNPLSTVGWTAEKMAREAESSNEKEWAELLTKDARNLEGQINLILKLVKIQHPSFRVRPLSPLLNSITDHYRKLTGHVIHCTGGGDISLLMEEESLKEVLVNLMDMAVDDLGSSPGEISIDVKPSYSPPGFRRYIRIRMRYRYSGVLKKAGERASNLYLCKEIINAHHGKLIFKESGERRVTVSIKMPLEQTQGSRDK